MVSLWSLTQKARKSNRLTENRTKCHTILNTVSSKTHSKEFLYIASFRYNDKWLVLKGIDTDSRYTQIIATRKYYLLDMEEDKWYGSMSKKEYKSFCKEKNISGMCFWKSTRFWPIGATSAPKDAGGAVNATPPLPERRWES